MTRPIILEDGTSLADALYRDLCDANALARDNAVGRRLVERHVESLARAAHSENPHLFAHYAAWTREALQWRGRSPAEFERFLSIAKASEELRALGLREYLDMAWHADGLVLSELAFSPMSERAAVAACAACVYYERYPERSISDGLEGQRVLLGRVEEHCKQLAAAIETKRHELFSEYAQFSALLLRWRGVSQDEFSRQLAAVGLAFRLRGTAKAASVAQKITAQAVEEIESRPLSPPPSNE